MNSLSTVKSEQNRVFRKVKDQERNPNNKSELIFNIEEKDNQRWIQKQIRRINELEEEEDDFSNSSGKVSKDMFQKAVLNKNFGFEGCQSIIAQNTKMGNLPFNDKGNTVKNNHSHVRRDMSQSNSPSPFETPYVNKRSGSMYKSVYFLDDRIGDDTKPNLEVNNNSEVMTNSVWSKLKHGDDLASNDNNDRFYEKYDQDQTPYNYNKNEMSGDNRSKMDVCDDSNEYRISRFKQETSIKNCDDQKLENNISKRRAFSRK